MFFTDFFQNFVKKTEDYFKLRWQTLQLQMVGILAELFAKIILQLFLGAIFFLSFLLLSVALAFYLGEILQKTYFGFLIVGFFYFLVGILVYIFKRKGIETKVKDAIVHQLLTKDDE